MNYKLKARIIELYVKQWKFARAIGVDDSTVSRVIVGRKELPDNEMIRWSEALKTDKTIFGAAQ